MTHQRIRKFIIRIVVAFLLGRICVSIEYT